MLEIPVYELGFLDVDAKTLAGEMFHDISNKRYKHLGWKKVFHTLLESIHSQS